MIGLGSDNKSLQAPPSDRWKRENVNWGEVADEPDDADHQGHPVHDLPVESRIFRKLCKKWNISILIYKVYKVQTPRFVNNNAKQMLHDHKEREYIWTNWWGMHSASFSPYSAVVLHHVYRLVTITGPASAFIQFTFVPKLHFSLG